MRGLGRQRRTQLGARAARSATKRCSEQRGVARRGTSAQWFHMLLLLGLGWLGRRPVAGGTATHSTYYYKRVAYIEEI